MELVLDQDEVVTLRDVFAGHLVELRREVARTDSRDFRHMLVVRQELVERLLAVLDGQTAG